MCTLIQLKYIPSTLALLIALAHSPSLLAHDDGEEWVRSPKEPKDKYIEIPLTDIYEVVVSKKAQAVIGELRSVPYKKIDESLAKYLTGHYFKKKEGQTSYLVRSVYNRGNASIYVVGRIGSALIIRHLPAGPGRAVSKSALIVNVDFEVTDVFTDAGGDPQFSPGVW